MKRPAILILAIGSLLTIWCCNDIEAQKVSEEKTKSERKLAHETMKRAESTLFAEKKLLPDKNGLVSLADKEALVMAQDLYINDPVWAANDAMLKSIANDVIVALREGKVGKIEFLCATASDINGSLNAYGIESSVEPEFEKENSKLFRENFQSILNEVSWNQGVVANIKTEVIRKKSKGAVLWGNAYVYFENLDNHNIKALKIDDLILTPEGWRATGSTWLLIRKK
jgi:hypothetical protein